MKTTGHGRDNLALAFAVTGGAVAWSLQVWLAWLLADLGCRLQPGDFTVAGLGTGGLWLLVGLATGVLALAALWAAWRLIRGRHCEDDHASGGARRFLAACAVVLNALLVATIALGTTAPVFVPACA
ncbi:MAG: hypothetical protein M3N29_09680 [Chloroflexota bacterium]|nr:hypothetical protein [Chloroflexota bacterium]